MEDSYKEVYFNEYCPTCKHLKTDENDDPCEECLSSPVNLYSHKPINWKENKTNGSNKIG